MNKFTTKIRHASPSILTGLSIAGVVGTTVMAVRATPKALQLIKDKKDELDTDHLKPMEVAQTTWKCYIPSHPYWSRHHYLYHRDWMYG